MEEGEIAIRQEAFAGKEGAGGEELVLVVVQAVVDGAGKKQEPGREPEEQGDEAGGGGGVQAGREMMTESRATSAGVMPLMRAAWPRVSGRTLASFWRVSWRRPMIVS